MEKELKSLIEDISKLKKTDNKNFFKILKKIKKK